MTRAIRHDVAAVAIYARYSTDRQDARSIDDQVRRCRTFAEARGLDVSCVLKDAAESGAHLDRGRDAALAASAPRREAAGRRAAGGGARP